MNCPRRNLMFDFLTIAFIAFLLVKGHYSISRKENAGQGGDHSTFLFTVFMLTCTMLWLAFKYAYKSTFLVLLALFFWPSLKNIFFETDTKDPTHPAKPG